MSDERNFSYNEKGEKIYHSCPKCGEKIGGGDKEMRDHVFSDKCRWHLKIDVTRFVKKLWKSEEKTEDVKDEIKSDNKDEIKSKEELDKEINNMLND